MLTMHDTWGFVQVQSCWYFLEKYGALCEYLYKKHLYKVCVPFWRDAIADTLCVDRVMYYSITRGQETEYIMKLACTKQYCVHSSPNRGFCVWLEMNKGNKKGVQRAEPICLSLKKTGNSYTSACLGY